MLRDLAMFFVGLLLTCSQAPAQEREWKDIPILNCDSVFRSVDPRVHKKVHLGALIAIENYIDYLNPRLATIHLRRDQVEKLAAHYEDIRQMMIELSNAEDAAWERSREESLKQREMNARIEEMFQELDPRREREFMSATLDREKLNELKTLAISAVIQEIGFEEMVKEAFNARPELKLTDDEIRAIREAREEIHWEMYREMARICREAWDKLVKKLPPRLVAKREELYKLDGIGK